MQDDAVAEVNLPHSDNPLTSLEREREGRGSLIPYLRTAV